MADDKTAAELKEDLKDATPEEAQEIVQEELARDTPRKSVLEAAGVDPNQRMDASGRVLNSWETSPKS